jgi:hypothetical protein
VSVFVSVFQALRLVGRRLNSSGAGRNKTENQMLDIETRASALPHPIPIEFVTIQLAPHADGKILVSLTATTVDEDEPQLLDQEIAHERVATLDELVALIRAHVRINAPAH